MREGVRYQMYESADGHVLFMASEQAFWKNFCEGIGRADLFERWPGSQYADHAKGNLELQAVLREIFRTKTSAEWLAFADEHNVPLAPVNTAKTIVDDPQFQHRFPLYGVDQLGRRAAPPPPQARRRGPARADQGPRASARTPTRSSATSSATTTPASPCVNPEPSVPTGNDAAEQSEAALPPFVEAAVGSGSREAATGDIVSWLRY